jgi:hypothetical protein
MTLPPVRRWALRGAVSATLAVLFLGFVYVYVALDQEIDRAQRAECAAVNEAFRITRTAIIQTAGFQRPVPPPGVGNPAVRAEIIAGNAQRRRFARARAAEIPLDVDCRGETARSILRSKGPSR